MLVCQLRSSLRRKCCSLFCLVLSKLQPMLLLEKNSWLQRDLSACFHASLSLSSSSSHRPLFAFSFPSEGVTAQRLAPHRSDWWLAEQGGVVSVSAVLKAPAALSEPALPQLQSAFSLQWSLERDRTAAPLQHNNIQGTFWGCFFFCDGSIFPTQPQRLPDKEH